MNRLRGRCPFGTLIVSACLACIPGVAAAQAALAGAVTDPSGAFVSGVTVEVSSPVLLERRRDVTTDGAGRYRIEDLRPGAYLIRFSASGWQPLERDGIVLSAGITTTVDAGLSPAGVNESVHVSAAVPLVDRYTGGHFQTLSRSTVSSLPLIPSYNALLGMVPGVVTSTNDVVTGTASTSFPIHGGRTSEGRLSVNGFIVGSPPSGNSATSYSVNVNDAEQITFVAGGGLGEQETAGLVMDLIPRRGGNAVDGSVYFAGTGKNLVGDNLTPTLQAQLAAPAVPLARVYDLWGSIGGPVFRNRLWYFANAHAGGYRRDSPNVFYNANAGNPAEWRYLPDPARREYSDRTFENASARVTWQATSRDQISGYWDQQSLCRTCTGATPGLSEPQTISPEAVGVLGRPLKVWQASWSSVGNSHLLLQAGVNGISFGVGNFERDPNPTRDLIRVVEQCAAGCAANGGIPGLVYRSQDFSVASTSEYSWKASASFVTGSRDLKVGYQHTSMIDDRTWYTNSQNLTYRFNNGIPNQLTMSISPWVNNARAASDALFAQGRWTRQRLTLQGAVRFDHASSWFPAQQEGPSRFLPAPIVIPETRGVDGYDDVTPRFGAAYSLRADGRSVVKVTVGKYLEGVGVSGIYANSNPTLRLPQTTSAFGTAGVTRTWDDANANLVPDCDLQNPVAQDLRSSGGDLCGVMSNTKFGTNVLTNNFDPRILSGWGVRPSDWNVEVAYEQKVAPTIAVRAAYIRRTFRGFYAVDNLAVQPTELTPYSIVAPADPRLPGGGQYRIDGLFDVLPEKAGQVDNFVTSADRYGDWTQSFNGFDLTIDARNLKGWTIAGGTSTGETVADNCEVRSHLPELATTATGTSAFGAGLMTSAVTPVSPYCHAAFGMLTQFRALSTYQIPKALVDVGLTIQSRPGAMLAANYAVPAQEVAAALGRPPSGNVANVTVNLIAPGSRYGDRVNEFDVRVARKISLGGPSFVIGLEVYNALNSSAVLTYNPAFVPGGTWLQPTAILTPRTFRLTGEFRF